MTRILVIDNEIIYHKVIIHAIQSPDCDVIGAQDGLEGLKLAISSSPDMIICDVMMPKMSGYDVTRSLRRDPKFSNTPILILTRKSGLEEKLAAFEAGADAYMTKPFNLADLIEQVNTLLRKIEDGKQVDTKSQTNAAYLIGVHSLRGGMGCTSLAVNLSIGLMGLWDCPTLLVDSALSTGQVSLMLNSPLRRTWADIVEQKSGKVNYETLNTIIEGHESGINFIAAPPYPKQAELVTDDLFKSAFDLLKNHFDYIVTDLPHDFNEKAAYILEEADVVLLVIAPEMASIRTALATLETYEKMGLNQGKVKIVLNMTFEKKGLGRKQIEAVLHRPIDLAIPFTPDLFIEAINFGKPFLTYKANDPVSCLVEDFTYQISKPEHRVYVPESPTKAWLRTSQRIGVIKS